MTFGHKVPAIKIIVARPRVACWRGQNILHPPVSLRVPWNPTLICEATRSTCWSSAVKWSSAESRYVLANRGYHGMRRQRELSLSDSILTSHIYIFPSVWHVLCFLVKGDREVCSACPCFSEGWGSVWFQFSTLTFVNLAFITSRCTF